MTAAELAKVLPERVRSAQIARMVVTMGGDGALYVDKDGSTGIYPARKLFAVI